MPPPHTYSLPEFATLTGVTPRTIRYYISEGLLSSPGAGPQARYTDEHLDRVRLIKHLQRNHLPLAEIRTQLKAIGADDVRKLLKAQAASGQPTTSALDYIRSVLGGSSPRPARSTPPPPPSGPPAMTDAAASVAEADAPQYRRLAHPASPPSPHPEPPQLQPDRSHWERIALDPDIELHIRRPLTRHQNRAVTRIIGTAREILEEDQT